MDVLKQKDKIRNKKLLIVIIISVFFYIAPFLFTIIENQWSSWSIYIIRIVYIVGWLISTISLFFSIVERKKKYGLVLILFSILILLTYTVTTILMFLNSIEQSRIMRGF